MELVVTEIKRSVDGLEGLKVNIDFLFFPLISNNSATINYETIGGDCEYLVSRDHKNYLCCTALGAAEWR